MVWADFLRPVGRGEDFFPICQHFVEILEIIQNSESEFNAIMAMQVPEIVPFENEDMKTKFYNMTKDVRASL